MSRTLLIPSAPPTCLREAGSLPRSSRAFWFVTVAARATILGTERL